MIKSLGMKCCCRIKFFSKIPSRDRNLTEEVSLGRLNVGRSRRGEKREVGEGFRGQERDRD